MRSPTLLLVALIAFVLFVAFIADFTIGVWDMFNVAMHNVAQNMSAVGGVAATYTEPSINPRWAADQMFPIILLMLWIFLLALIALVAEALRKKRGGGDDEE